MLQTCGLYRLAKEIDAFALHCKITHIYISITYLEPIADSMRVEFGESKTFRELQFNWLE